MHALDAFMPEFEFSERHAIAVDAVPERIDRALRDVRVDEIPLLHILLMLRGIRARGPFVEAIPGARVLEDAPGEGLVLGLEGQFWRLRGGSDGGPAAKAIIDFRIGRGVVTTETRVQVADEGARRKFARYWRVVRPFSGLVRVLVLRRVKRRAERA